MPEIDAILSDFVSTSLSPRSPEEVRVYANELVNAYARLSTNHDFRLMVRELTMYVIEQDNSDGERRLLRHILMQVRNAEQYMEARKANAER